MTGFVKPQYTIVVVMLVSCLVGVVLARNRGRSIVGWGIVCALFPPLMLVIWFLKPRSRPD